MRILVTGAAGFIGYHVSRKLLNEGYTVIGVDNLNDYYDVQLKKDRLSQLNFPQFHFVKASIESREEMENIFKLFSPEIVIHLAAQAGVRYSLKNPYAYVDSNLVGFMNILEECRKSNVEHLIYASSSSVYGANKKMPFSVMDSVDHPVSLYAATKKANELMAHTYSHLYGLPTTGLRFFTVYGPWGRPDMALFIFTRSIIEGKPIEIYNNGNMKRDFTYIDDIVEGIYRLVDSKPVGDSNWDSFRPIPGTSYAPYKVYNIGNHSPVHLLDFIKMIERKLGKQALREMLPLQPGDVAETYADVSDLYQDIGFSPKTPIEEGISHFIEWYKEYYLNGNR